MYGIPVLYGIPTLSVVMTTQSLLATLEWEETDPACVVSGGQSKTSALGKRVENLCTRLKLVLLEKWSLLDRIIRKRDYGLFCLQKFLPNGCKNNKLNRV